MRRSKFLNWQVVFGLLLIALSALVYFIHYLIFHDLHHIFIYLIGDIAFLFLEVLLVTLVLHKFLTWRERKSLLNKMNMLIGTFFSEVGTQALKQFKEFDAKADEIGSKLCVSGSWSSKKFIQTRKFCKDIIWISIWTKEVLRT